MAAMEIVLYVIYFLLFITFIAGLGIRIVPLNQVFVVERLGAYNKTLEVGVHFIFPLMDRIVRKIDITEQTVSVSHVGVHVEMKYQVTDAKLFHYGVPSFDKAVEAFIKKAIESKEIEDIYYMNTSVKAWGIMINEIKKNVSRY